MREGFTQIDNNIYTIGLKPNEGWLCTWMLSHKDGFVPSYRYIARTLGLKYDTLKEMIPKIIEKLSESHFEHKEELIKKLSQIGTKSAPKSERKCSQIGTKSAPKSERKCSQIGTKSAPKSEHKNTIKNINKNTNWYSRKTEVRKLSVEEIENTFYKNDFKKTNERLLENEVDTGSSYIENNQIKHFQEDYKDNSIKGNKVSVIDNLKEWFAYYDTTPEGKELNMLLAS